MGSEGARAMEGDVDKKKHNGKRHDKSFKVAAAERVTEQGYAAKAAASSPGVRVGALEYGVKVYGQGPQEQAGTMETVGLRVEELERQNQRLLMEKGILKKAAAF